MRDPAQILREQVQEYANRALGVGDKISAALKTDFNLELGSYGFSESELFGKYQAVCLDRIKGRDSQLNAVGQAIERLNSGLKTSWLERKYSIRSMASEVIHVAITQDIIERLLEDE